MTALPINPSTSKSIFKRWSNELKIAKKSTAHLGLAQTILLQPHFKPGEFALLLARLMSMHLRGYKRNID